MADVALARPAATIVLMRDGADGMEVFMVVRHHAIDFASGALVFPGGRVEEPDFALADDSFHCPNPEGLSRQALGFRIAAVRETFEECGVLYARKRGARDLIGADELLVVENAHRVALGEGKVEFRTVLEAHDLVPATDLLTHFAHWITPKSQPKRYDTEFYLAHAPSAHLAVHDGTEAVDSVWIRPIDALTGTEEGRFKLVFATQLNLAKLATYRTAADAITDASGRKVVTVLPELARMEGKQRVMRIPLEAGYGAAEFVVTNPPAS